MCQTVLVSELTAESEYIKFAEGWMGRFKLDVPNLGEVVKQDDCTRFITELIMKDGHRLQLTGRIQWESAESC